MGCLYNGFTTALSFMPSANDLTTASDVAHRIRGIAQKQQQRDWKRRVAENAEVASQFYWLIKTRKEPKDMEQQRKYYTFTLL